MVSSKNALISQPVHEIPLNPLTCHKNKKETLDYLHIYRVFNNMLKLYFIILYLELYIKNFNISADSISL